MYVPLVHVLPTHVYERAFVNVRYLRRYIRVCAVCSGPGRCRAGAQENGLSAFQSGLERTLGCAAEKSSPVGGRALSTFPPMVQNPLDAI